MNHVPPPPLTPEERALADALARMDGPAAPPARLDAAIRAAARDALAPAADKVAGVAMPGGGVPPVPGRPPAARATAAAARAQRRPRRWAAGMGIAASVVLAVGVAWQLRPLPSDGVAYDEAPVQRVLEESIYEVAPRAPVASSAPPAAAVPEPAPADAEARPATAAQDRVQGAPDAIAPPRARTSAPSPLPASAPEEPPVVFDDPSPMDTPAPPPAPPQAAATEASPASAQRGPAPPPAPPAPPPPASAPAQTLDRTEVTGSRIAPPAAAARAERETQSAPELDRDAWYDDQPLDDQPPATFDAPDVREAWLSRIRELRDAGQIAPARASLAEFRRRYPDVALPDDLRPLLD